MTARIVADRHWLAWPAVEPEPISDPAQDIAPWHACGRPFVVCRNVTGDSTKLALGCCRPVPGAKPSRAQGWVPATALLRATPPPLPADVAETAPPAWRQPLRELAVGPGMAPRVYGSFAWQHLTGEAYVRDGSDIDLLWTARTRRDVTAIGSLLDAWEGAHGLRVDGEISIDGGAVAWREAVEAVTAGAGDVLVKRLQTLEVADHRSLWP